MIGRAFLVGAAVAAGALLLVPGVASAAAKAARPLARRAMKTGAAAALGAQRAAAEAYEHFEDLAAEVQADLEADDLETEPDNVDAQEIDTAKAANGAGAASR